MVQSTAPYGTEYCFSWQDGCTCDPLGSCSPEGPYTQLCCFTRAKQFTRPRALPAALLPYPCEALWIVAQQLWTPKAMTVQSTWKVEEEWKRKESLPSSQAIIYKGISEDSVEVEEKLHKNTLTKSWINQKYFVILEEKAIFLINKGSSGDWEMWRVTIWRPFSIPRSALDCFQRTPIQGHQPFLWPLNGCRGTKIFWNHKIL